MPVTTFAPDTRPSYWLESLPAERLRVRASLDGDTQCDVAIVGAGYTGLWTAYYLLQQEPSLRVVLIEAAYAGYGASGRNGGWASAIMPMSLESVAKGSPSGRAGAIALQRAMNDAVDEVGRVAAAEGIECDFAKGGTIKAATNPAHLPRIAAAVEASKPWGVEDFELWDAVTAAERIGIDGILGAKFSPHCAAVHPAKLVRGLADVVERLGATIVERTRALRIEAGAVETDHGRVRAPHVIRALEGFTSGLDGERRTIVPVYSLMVATEPLPPSFWERAKLHDRATFGDARHRVIYGQRTADDRIAFGGRGAFYHLGSRVRPDFDRVSRVHDAIRSVLRDLFPYMPADVHFTHAWGGPLGIPRDWHCSVGLDPVTGLGWGGGYVGDGVTTTNLAGRTLADLVLRNDTERVGLPWVGHRSRRWEPEPLRYLGVNGGLSLAGVCDRWEHKHGRSNRALNAVLDRLVG